MKRQLFALVLSVMALSIYAEGYECFKKEGLTYSVVSQKYRIASIQAQEQQESVVLKKAIIPKKVWHKGRRYKVMIIGDGAFGGCWQLRHVELPECVTTIGKGAFAWCISLEEITLPASVCVIGSDAFSSCAILKSIYVPAEHVERIQQLLPKELRYLVKAEE